MNLSERSTEEMRAIQNIQIQRMGLICFVSLGLVLLTHRFQHCQALHSDEGGYRYVRGASSGNRHPRSGNPTLRMSSSDSASKKGWALVDQGKRRWEWSCTPEESFGSTEVEGLWYCGSLSITGRHKHPSRSLWESYELAARWMCGERASTGHSAFATLPVNITIFDDQSQTELAQQAFDWCNRSNASFLLAPFSSRLARAIGSKADGK